MLLLLRTAALTGSATVDIVFGLSGALSDVSTLTASATLGISFGVTAVATGSAALAGPTDTQRISTGAYRKKKRKKIGPQGVREETRPAIPSVRPPAPLQAPQPVDFQALAQVAGKSLDALRAEVDSEIAELMREIELREDDEEVGELALILATIE